MKKTAKWHTAFYAFAAVVFTAFGIWAAHDIRGYWAFGGEYFIPFLMCLAWFADMALLGRLSKGGARRVHTR